MKMDELITKGATEQSVGLFRATVPKYETWVCQTLVIVEQSQIRILKTCTVKLQQSYLRFTYIFYHHWIFFFSFHTLRKNAGILA